MVPLLNPHLDSGNYRAFNVFCSKVDDVREGHFSRNLEKNVQKKIQLAPPPPTPSLFVPIAPDVSRYLLNCQIGLSGEVDSREAKGHMIST